jgi:Ca2+-binding RTX toxin-like protein
VSAINGTGNALDNVLTGNSAANTLDGGTGNDTYVIDNIVDVIIEAVSAGTDTVQSSITYTLTANVENLTLTGASAINGTGNALDNLLTGNSAANTLDGGAGNDTYVIDNAGDVAIEVVGGGTDTVLSSVSYSLNANVENLTLIGSGNTNGGGNALNNVVTGNSGVNFLDGAAGSDTLIGGAGDDIYLVDVVTDIVIENAGEGTDMVQSLATFTLSANVENLMLVGASTINATGNALNNSLIGNPADNVLDGGVGADTLNGAAGNDTYVVDDAGDIVVEAAGTGTDTVQSSISYTLVANVENLNLIGAGAINGTGNTLNNVISGNGAANTLDGGTGSDTMVGGSGDDIYVVDMVTDVVTENAGEGTDLVQSSVTYTLGANVENLTLTGATAINGAGNAQDNVLTGNSAANTLTGGAGNDTYVVDNAGDVVTEAAGAGTDTVQSSITYTLGANVENLMLIGASAINGTGNTLDNVLSGNGAANVLTGGTGNDTYYVSTGDSVVEAASAGTDVIYSDVTYTLNSNVENLVLIGVEAINGTGNALNNVLTGNTAANVLAGGPGDDTYVVDNVGDVITEALPNGSDTVLSSVSYALPNNVENLTLIGVGLIDGTGNGWGNVLTGNSAANTLSGGAGNDTYVIDSLADTVIENPGEGLDTVQASISYVLGANVENLTLTGAAAIDGTGNTLSNVLTGNAAANTLTGGPGNDTYVVDNVGDAVVENANEGTDTVQASISYVLGTNVENLTLTGAAAINGTGNSLNNVLTGNTAANTLTGGLGNDTYVVDNVGDTVAENANEGTDTVQASISYVLGATVENLTLTGTAAINGTGNALANMLTGNSGANTLTGGLGDDTYVVNDVGDVVVENANEGTDTVQASLTYVLGATIENLTLIGSSTIDGTGNLLNNVLTGNNSANLLDGGAGADSMSGGTGNDTYVVDDVSDIVTEGAGAGTDTVQTSITYVLGANVENLTLTGGAAINGTGNTLNNVLTGNSAANTLTGGSGNDTYVVDNAGDVVIENLNEGTDTVQASISYVLGANVENLTLTGTGIINGTGNSLNNSLTGNAKNNLLDGGPGADTMLGGAFNDTYVVDDVGDMVIETTNTGAFVTDTVLASVSYTLSNNVENLTLTGTAAINATGNSLNNVLTGNSAANTLTGSLGDDTYVVDNVGDIVIENLNEGTDSVQASITYTLSANVEKLILTGATAINGTGNASDNLLTGNSAANTLTGGVGNDTYVVDNVGDIVIENLNQGTDSVQASISYVLGANVENLTLTGSAAITGTGNALNNILTANASPYVMSLTGGLGDDTYVIGNNLVVENPNEGTDTVVIYGQGSIYTNYVLPANVENLTVLGYSSGATGVGNNLNNVLTGSFASDSLSGGAGNDTLDGNGGPDTLIGGIGNDTYMLRAYWFSDNTILENDATAGNTDIVQFFAGINYDQIWFRHIGNDLEVSLIGTGDEVMIQNWYSGSAYHTEQFKTADNKLLLDTQVETLVQAMAAFAPPAAGQTTLPQNYQDALAATLAANWI